MSRKHKVLSGLALFAATFVSAIGGDAVACGGEWYPIMRIDPRIHGIARAEKALNEGRAAAAGASVVRMIPHIKTLDGTKAALIARAERVLALSVARSGGGLPAEAEIPRHVQASWLGETSEQRAENLNWATQVLKRQSDEKQDDPALLTDLAEAMSKVEGQRDHARQLLETLAQRDLIATPQGYRVLAELRGKAGDARGATAALERCRALSGKSAGATCPESAQG